MSLFIPGLLTPIKVIRDVVIPSYNITKTFIIPSFGTLAAAGDPQLGSIVFITSFGEVRIGTPGGWNIVSGTSSTLSLAPGALGASIVASGVAPNLLVKGIAGGTGVTVTVTPTDVIITGNVTPSLTAGSGISIAGNTINNTSPGIVYTAGTGVALTVNNFSNTGVLQISPANTTVSVSGTQQNPIVGGNFVAGNGISIVGNVINNLSNGTVLSITAGDTTVVVGGTLSNPTITGNYQAGTNIGITGNVISILGGISSITNLDGTISITGPAITPTLTGNYQAGGNVTIVGNAIDVTPYPTSLTSGDSIVTIVGSGTPTPTIALSYSAGSNVTIVGNVINSTLPGVSSLTAANNTVLVTGTVLNPIVTGNYVAGSGVSITGTNVVNAVNPFVNSVTADVNNTVTVTGTTNVVVAGNYQAGTGIAITGNIIDSSSSVVPSTVDRQMLTFLPNQTGGIQIFGISGGDYTFFLDSNGSSYVDSNINGAFPTVRGYYIAEPMVINSITCLITPCQIAGLVFSARVYTNGNVVLSSQLSTTDSRNVISGPIYMPAGSMMYVAINYTVPALGYNPNGFYAALSLAMETGQTTAIAAPAAPVSVSTSATTSTTIGLAISTPSGTTVGYRIIYKTGSYPSSWTDPTGIQVDQFRSYIGTFTLFDLTPSTTYYMLIYGVNSNTPPTMSLPLQYSQTTTP